jgi:hypothetical protein
VLVIGLLVLFWKIDSCQCLAASFLIQCNSLFLINFAVLCMAAGATRPARGIGSSVRYGNHPPLAADQYEQRRIARNPAICSNGVSSRSS